MTKHEKAMKLNLFYLPRSAEKRKAKTSYNKFSFLMFAFCAVYGKWMEPCYHDGRSERKMNYMAWKNGWGKKRKFRVESERGNWKNSRGVHSILCYKLCCIEWRISVTNGGCFALQHPQFILHNKLQMSVPYRKSDSEWDSRWCKLNNSTLWTLNSTVWFTCE